MVQKIIPTLLVTLFAIASLWGQASQKLTLEEAVNLAIRQNLEVKNAQLKVANADQQIRERLAVGLPQLNGEVSFQRYLQIPQQPLPESFNIFGIFGQALAVDLRDQLSDETRNAVDQIFSGAPSNNEGPQTVAFFLRNNFTAGVNLDAMVFDASYFIALRAARAFKVYSQKELQTTQREVRNRVIDAYLPVLLVDENLELLNKNIDNLSKLLFETKELYKAGFAEQLDVDRQQLSLANLTTERENLERQRKNALDNLKFAIGLPAEAEVELESELDALVKEAAEADLTGVVVPEQRPEYGLLQQAIELNQINVKLSQSQYYPSLRAFGAYQQSYQGNDFQTGFWAPTAFLGLRLNVPIFDGFLKNAQVQRAKIDLEVAHNQLVDLDRGINLEVQSARTAYINARRQLASQQSNLELAQRIYDTTQVKYREGVGSSLEVTQAEQSLYATQSNYLQAIYDLVVAKSDLEQALGKGL